MEREIMVKNSRTQSFHKLTIGDDVVTLGDLKKVLDENGIDYRDMDFIEGFSKTHFLNDDAQLPKEVMHKGVPTNNLAILLTNTKKKIDSGEGSRKEAYAIIKSEGLAESIKKKCGCNYTNLPTETLWKLINAEDEEDLGCDEEEEDEDTIPCCENMEEEHPETETSEESTIEDLKAKAAYHLSALAQVLNQLGILSNEEESVSCHKEEKKEPIEMDTSEGTFTQENFDDLFKNL